MYRKLYILIIFISVFVVCGVSANPWTQITSWGGGSAGSSLYYLNDPQGVAVSSDGHFFIADTLNNRIVKVYFTGTTVSYVAHVGGFGTGNLQFKGPRGISIGSDGNLYIVDQGNYCVKVIDQNFNFIRKFGIEAVNQFGQTPPYPYGSFLDMGKVIEHEGEIYVSDVYRSDVQVFDIEGNYLRHFGTTNNPSATPGSFVNPRGIAIGYDGYVYIGDESRIQVFTKSGTYIREWGGDGVEVGQFRRIYDISIDYAGRVYVAEWSNRRVQVFESDGAYISMFSGFTVRPMGVSVKLNTGHIFMTNNYDHRVSIRTGYAPPEIPPTVADFNYDIISSWTFQFTSLSSDAFSQLWDFGDGNFSTEQNPIHTYQNEGVYTVSLTTTNPFSEDTITKTVYLFDTLRPPAIVTLAPVPVDNYNSLIGAFGGHDTYEGDGLQVDFMATLDVIEFVYTDSMGFFFYILVFSLPFIVQWLRQGNMAVPGTLGIITAGYLLMYLPAEYHLVAITFIALSVLAVIWGIVKERV